MKNLKFLAFLAVSAMFFTSCVEDEEKENKEALLTGKNWKLTAQTSDPGIPFDGTIVTDLYSQSDACDKDDMVKFNSNGTMSFDEGASKCDIEDPQTKPGNWAFNTDKTIVSVTSNNTTMSFTILELTKKTFKFTYPMRLGNLVYTITETYRAE